MRVFNTSGPCDPARHYMLAPAVPPGARSLVERASWFTVRAPRRSGKTTALAALAADITAGGRQVALLASCEPARACPADIEGAERAILAAITEAAEACGLPGDCQPPPWPQATPGMLLSDALRVWAQSCPRPLVVLLDDFDAVTGRAMLSVTAQLRADFAYRPRNFPASVVLCGLHDVRGYEVPPGPAPDVPFNVIEAKYRMADFTRDQVAELYGQHTADTGQHFTDEAIDLAFDYTQGQPWLVNAIGRETTAGTGVNQPQPVAAAQVERAKEQLIRSGGAHFRYLAGKIAEPRVTKIVGPVLEGRLVDAVVSSSDWDIEYVRDLGLIREDSPLAVANPSYGEVIARCLAG